MTKLEVEGIEINTKAINEGDYISLTDIARKVNPLDPRYIVKNWIRGKDTIAYLGLWEMMNNSNFNRAEFEVIKGEAGYNKFSISPTQWATRVNAIGIVSKFGKRDGGTYAHVDIALEFASWVSPEFKLYLMTEFKRLKESEQKELGWDLRRTLSKINYGIHTDAIKNNLIPFEVTKEQMQMIYASEADLINVAIFGKTAKQWRNENPKLEGNMRDYANVAELVCLVNLENLNSVYINEGMMQSERLQKLNQIAIRQMKLLISDNSLSNILK